MTRFARAKGSKASNERVPEDATSWTEMKDQLQRKQKQSEDDEKRNEIIAKRQESYNKFLNEQQNVEKKVEWADFSDLQLIQSFKKNKINKQNNLDNNVKNNGNMKTTEGLNNKKKNGDLKRKKEKENNESEDNNTPKKKKEKKEKPVDSENNSKEENPEFIKKKKNKIVLPELTPYEELSEADKSKVNKKKARRAGQLEKRKLIDIKQAKSENSNGDEDIVQDSPKKTKISTFQLPEKVPYDELSEADKLKVDKKKARRARQLEKRKLIKQIRSENSNGDEDIVEDLPKKKKKMTFQLPELVPYDELSEADKLIVDKKKARRARQQEKRKLIKQMKSENSNSDNVEDLAKKSQNKENDGKSVKKVEVEKIPYEELSEAEKLKVDKKKAKLTRQLEKRKTFKELKKIEMEKNKDESENKEASTTKNLGKNDFSSKQANGVKMNGNNESGNKFKNNKNSNENKKSKPPLKDKTGKEIKRKKPMPVVQQIEINGKLTDIVYMDGFPVLKEDADNLKELKESMIKKGLPRSEIAAAMKLARRRAEKNLTRKKRNVCFNCRQSGHVLSECPNLAQEENPNSISSGVCFKCGSTEHTHFQCKVVRSQEFKFATCFICKEQGHISRQCPDNAKGLYPKGGACKLCGDVTHLKKDCPKRLAEIESNNIGLDRIGDDIEGLGEQEKFINAVIEKKRVNKVIKF